MATRSRRGRPASRRAALVGPEATFGAGAPPAAGKPAPSPAPPDSLRVAVCPRINYSLWHAGRQQVVERCDLPSGAQARVRLGAGLSEEVAFAAGEQAPFTPPLDASQFARLGAPVQTQLVVEVAGGGVHSYPTTVSPLSAWDLRRNEAKATAAFVLENDPLVARLVDRADAGPAAAGRGLPPAATTERVYAEVVSSLKPRYLYERQVFAPHEQAVRFPLQMLYDLGGTCIDFVLLFAAALFRAGCEPLVLILGDEQGYGHRHALVGVWQRGCRPRPPRPLLGPGDLAIARREEACFAFDATWAAEGRPFAEALAAAARALADLGLLWAVDVAAAREAGILSLPGPASQVTQGGWAPKILDHRTKTLTSAAEQLLHRYSLEVVASKTPSDRGKRWPIRSYCVHIGWGPQHEVDLDEPTVSNPHAVVAADESEVFLIDLFSKNGTFVAGRRLLPSVPTPLAPGEDFTLAGVTLRLVGPAGSATAAAGGETHV